MLVLVPVHVDRDQRIVTFEEDPRPLPSVLVGIHSHGCMLLEDVVDTIVTDDNAVSRPKHVGDGNVANVKMLIEIKHTVFEIVRVIGKAGSTRRLQLGHLIGFSVWLDELLNTSLADLQLLCDNLGRDVMGNNSLTYRVDVRLLKLHFARLISGQIMSTKSLANTARDLPNRDEPKG